MSAMSRSRLNVDSETRASAIRGALWTAVVVAVVGGLKLILLALSAAGIWNFATPFPSVVLGVIVGMTYGLLGVGLVLIYRTNRIINFAHGYIGVFGSAMFGLLVARDHVPYWLCLPIALAISGGIGAAAETGVVRRLRKVPRLVSVVATLGVGQFLATFALVINSRAAAGALFPQPSGMPTFGVGKLTVTQAYSGMLFLTPVLVAGVALFLRFSRFGLALRAAADNPEAARMSGIFSSRMSSLAWAMAGALSCFSAVLTQPTSGFSDPASFGPQLLLRALTCAVVARMESMPVALATGIGLGVLQQLITWNYSNGGLLEAVMLVIVLVALLVQKGRGGRDEEKGSWAAVASLRPVAPALRELWLVRNLARTIGVAVLAVAVLLPLGMANSLSYHFIEIMAFAIVGISIGILSGLAGQLTLGQFAVAAIGAVIAYDVSSKTGDYGLAILYAGLGAGIVSVLLGLPSLRIRGLMLTVTTLSFALATPDWLLSQSWMLGSGKQISHPRLFGISFSTGRSYYYFALGALVLCTLLAHRVRRSGFGRLLVAVRDNEDNARAFTVSSATVKLKGYMLAGFVAGIGGAVYAFSVPNISATTFPTEASIDVVVMTVIGGLSVTWGPILGAFYVIGIPLLPLDTAGLAATQLGSLLLVLLLPGGLASGVTVLRDRLYGWWGRRAGVSVEVAAEAVSVAAEGVEGAAQGVDVGAGVVEAPAVTAPVVTVHSEAPSIARRRVLLDASDLHKQFGGVVAVRDVSLQVRAGEILGLIGPNGAGKTTTFELLGGFTRPDWGHIEFDQRDITYESPEARARLGLIRSFQDAFLFPTLTVAETVKLAFERISPTGLANSLVDLGGRERNRQRRADELIGNLGLHAYRDKQIQELSTGTRRITEIACLVALEPALLLLDEPSSGIAQRETEALGSLLVRLKRQMDLTLVIIEHDIPLIMGISDRIVAMADGVVLCAGRPDEVRADPRVVESYLGGSLAAIERSGSQPAPAGKPERSGSQPARTGKQMASAR